jgi:D-proline reductase (dithiol) PrdB
MNITGLPMEIWRETMGNMSEFTWPVRLFLKAYPWRTIDPVPWTPLKKPLAQCRLALVSSAGFTQSDQEPFDESVRGGDPSLRRIPSNAKADMLTSSHRSHSFDPIGMRRDTNLAFPIDRARELVESRRIASVSRHHLSFMGSITAPGRLIRNTAPRAARWLAADGVDAAILVPV